MNPCRVAPRVKAYKGLADPKSAESIHMCVAEQMMHLRVTCYQGLADQQLLLAHTHTNRCGAEYVSSRLHPTFNGCKGFADQVLLRAYTCVLQKSGPEPEVEILSRLRREHTHVPCRLGHLRVAPEGQGLQGLQGFARLLRAYICVLQNKLNQGCTKGTKYYKASADQVLLQAYMCVLQNDKTQGFTQGSTDTQRFG